MHSHADCHSPSARSRSRKNYTPSELVGVAGFEPAASSSRTSGTAGRLAVVPGISVCWRSCWLAAVRAVAVLPCCTLRRISSSGRGCPDRFNLGPPSLIGPWGTAPHGGELQPGPSAALELSRFLISPRPPTRRYIGS